MRERYGNAVNAFEQKLLAIRKRNAGRVNHRGVDLECPKLKKLEAFKASYKHRKKERG